jgi:hypothetical protein
MTDEGFFITKLCHFYSTYVNEIEFPLPRFFLSALLVYVAVTVASPLRCKVKKRAHLEPGNHAAGTQDLLHKPQKGHLHAANN